MNFIEQFQLGISTYADAHRLITKHKLWGYIIAPGIINIIIFILSTIYILNFSDEIIERVLSYLSANFEIAGFISNNRGVISFILSLIIKIAFFMAYFSIYKYIVLILMSPLLALLSERVEKIITGNEYPFTFIDFVKDVLRGILLAVRNMLLELFLLIAVFILSFIPVINIAAPFLSFFIASYYYGFSMLDYSNERRKFTIRRSIHFIRMQRGLAIGNGAVFYMILMIPLIGWLIAPAYSVTAAAIARERLK